MTKQGNHLLFQIKVLCLNAEEENKILLLPASMHYRTALGTQILQERAAPALWSRLEHCISTTNGLIDVKFCADIHVSHKMNLTDDLVTFPQALPMRLTFVSWVKCLDNYWMDCHEIWFGHSCSRRMNCNNFSEPLTFHLASLAGHNFNLSNTLVNDWISAILMTFPSASALLTCTAN